MSAHTQTIVDVEETLAGRYLQTARTGRHALSVDEPKAAGGNDAGPGPYEYLLIGLGACTAMTLRMYAEMKDLPLVRVHVRLSHRKIHAQDCADCETQEGRVDEISREIRLEGDLTEGQRERLLELANRCPVHRTLTHLGDQGAFVPLQRKRPPWVNNRFSPTSRPCVSTPGGTSSKAPSRPATTPTAAPY